MLTAKTPYCPSHEDLADFAAGTVTAERLETLSAHIDTCVVCQATIAELSDSADSFVAALRTSQGVVEEESACRQALEQMLNQRGRVAASGKPSVSLPEFVGPYRVLEPIAAGGMGMVLRAQHPKLKRTVAIKLLPLQQWAGSTAVARFEREMEVIGNLDHPNIVRASDAGDAGGMHYLVMDFIDGTDLSQLVHRLGPLPVADACEIARQAAIGLQYVHDAGLVHRDIKPSNIMLTGDGRVKILDLGLAMLNEQFSEDANNLTTVGQLMGTLDYMSPEQAADSRQVDARADIYSLGATLFKLLTGQAPYGGPTHRSLLKKVLALASGPVPSVCAIRSDVPIELDQIVQRCLDKSIESRFTRVAEVAEALAPLAATAQLSALAHEAAQRAHRDPAETPSWNWVPRDVDQPSESAAQAAKPRKFIAAIVGVAALALLIACGVLIRIATDRGELIVRSDDPHAQIRITRVADQSVEDIAVEKGEKRTVVKSGEYTVELLGDGDEWTLSPTSFTMQRGGQKVLQVQRGPLTSDSSDAAGLMGSSGMGMPGMGGMGSGWAGMGGMPGASGGGSGLLGGATGRMVSPSAMMQPGRTYDGKSYEQWMQLLEVDRSPITLLQAIRAIEILMPKGHDERVARTLLQVMCDHGSYSSDSSPKGQLIEATESMLFELNPVSVSRAILAELPNINERAAVFLCRYFGIGLSTRMGLGTSEEWLEAMVAAAPEIAARVLESSRDDTQRMNTHPGAMLFVAGSLVTKLNLDVAAIPGFLAHCREALRSESDLEAFSAATVLAHFEPDADGITEALIRFVSHPEFHNEAVDTLRQLGARAQTALQDICDRFLTSEDNQEAIYLSSGIVSISRALGDPMCGSAIAYMERAREKVSPEERELVDRRINDIRTHQTFPFGGSKMPGTAPGGPVSGLVGSPGSLMPGGGGSFVPGSMYPNAGGSVPGYSVPGVMPGTLPPGGPGGAYPGAGQTGSLMPGAGSMMPGSGVPSTTVPGEDAAPPDAENKETPGTNDGTSQAPANALPGGLLSSGAGSPGSLPGGSGGVSGGNDTQEKYDGKSYTEWMTVLETERSAERLLEALNAIRELMPEGDDARVAGVLLRLMRTYGDALRQSGSRGNFVSAARSQFGLLSAEGIIQAVRVELPKLNYDQAEFLSEVLRSGFRDPSRTTPKSRSERAGWCDAIRNAAPQLVAEALELSRTTDGSVDTAAMLNLAETLSMLAKLDVREIEGFLPRFSEALRSEDDRAVLAAASVLVIHEPETEGLAEVVVRFLGNAPDATRTIQLLRALGPRAKPVIPELIKTMLHPKNSTDKNDLLIAIVQIGDIAIPDLEAARTGADNNAAKRIDHAVRCIQNRSFPLVAPYGTITELYESKDSATPTETTPPHESDSATPNADVKQSDKAEAGGDSNTPSPSTDKDSQ